MIDRETGPQNIHDAAIPGFVVQVSHQQNVAVPGFVKYVQRELVVFQLQIFFAA